MTGPPLISFAIPYYDNRDYLAEAIESVRRQSVDSWNLVVVDDDGPEPAHELVASLEDPRVRYVRNVHRRGLPGNWNECLAQTSGPLVTLLHGDDRLLPRYAERVLEAAERHPSAAAYFTDVAIIDRDGRTTRTYVDFLKRFVRRRGVAGEIVGDVGLARLLAGNFIYCPTLSLRRAAVGATPFDESWRFVCDWDLTTRLLMSGRTLVGLDEPLLEYRRHEAQTTARLTLDEGRFHEELRFSTHMSDRAAQLGLSRAERAARWRIATRAHVGLSALLDLVHGRAGPAQRKASLLARDLRSMTAGPSVRA